MKINSSKIPSISVIRVLAMLSIILGHWCASVGINDYQLLALGVEIFLFISGYLYSKKNIENNRVWLIQRWVKIILPYWIVLSIITITRLVLFHEIDYKHLIMNIFNIQGMNRIFLFIDTGSILGMGQTWFLSILMVCYILMVIVKNSRTEKLILEHRKAFLAMSIILQMALLLGKVQIIYIICFFLGYFWQDITRVSRLQYIMITGALIVMCVCRVCTRSILDGSIIYDQVIARWSFIVLAVWVIITANLICNRYYELTEKISNALLWKTLDYLSYPLFLTHYMFLVGDLAVSNFIGSIWGKTIIFVVLAVAEAVLVMFIADRKGLAKITSELLRK